MYKINKSSNQLRWVILLLVLAVILPTVCLLWFMTQAVKNERLALRQKLIDFYTEQTQTLFIDGPRQYWQQQRELIGSQSDQPPSQFVSNSIIFSPSQLTSAIVLDSNRNIIWPKFSLEDPNYPPDRQTAYDKLAEIWETEFSKKDYSQAAERYRELASDKEAPLWWPATMAQARCLQKTGQSAEAANTYQQIAWPEKIPPGCQHLVIQARLALLELYKSLPEKDFAAEFEKQITIAASRLLDLDTPTEVFYLTRLLEVCSKTQLVDKVADDIKRCQQIIEADSVALEVAQKLNNPSALENWPEGEFRRLEIRDTVFCCRWDFGKCQVLPIASAASITDFWQKITTELDDKMVFCRVVDETGKIIAGQPETYRGRLVLFGQKFLSHNLGKPFPDWKIELYFRYGIFSAAARRQRIIYFWTAVLVITLMLIIMFLSSRAILKQAKLSRLKNDFIATVTHELKTPLSSMRVLVDTLIEKNYDDVNTPDKYLGLIAQENKRLSRLIDNFLTFSRMERNKHAFDIAPASPVEIANTAVAAVQTKFENESVKFDMTVLKPLPMINADKDAIVTVLVNLLDNACKYSYDNKQIELKVFREDNFVCFSVRDNGIGMTRRQTKRIFDRFYQADSSLSRRAEGSGLGLAIVKFIIDAHRGRIDIESKLGKGSEFIVKINIV